MTTKTSNPDQWIFTGVKPLSANEAFAPRANKRGRFYRGEIYKTAAYKRYENKLLKTLPNIHVPEKGKLQLTIKVLYSSAASDIDNCLKPFIDVLQKRYSFNDNRIYKIKVVKDIVKKGEEGIWFLLKDYSPPSKLRRFNDSIRKTISEVWRNLGAHNH
jgi:Holliday junction resolvase RusA-like endonuclease